MGLQAIDAFKREFGEYLSETFEIMGTEWQRIEELRATYPPSGSFVRVTFILNSKGETTIVGVEQTTGKPSVYACLAAIQARQPYKPWTKEMITLLGHEQTLTFRFDY